jgi:transcription-repair coupling factor (superfamily II helicase)
VVKPDGSWAEAKFGGEPLRDQPLLTWCAQLLETILGPVLQAVLSN